MLRVEAEEFRENQDESSRSRNESDSLIRAHEKSSSYIGQIFQILKKFFVGLISTHPSHPLFPPADLTNIKGEFLAIIVPVGLLFLFEVWNVLFTIVIWQDVIDPTALLILVIAFSLIGTTVRSIVGFIIDRIEKEPNFELPKSILLILITESLIISYSRYLLWKTTGIVYFVYLVVCVLEDAQRGIFNLFSYKLPDNRIFRWLRTENSKEAHEIVLLNYTLRKQLQFVITGSFYVYWIVVHFYWNNVFFGEIIMDVQNFTSVCYLIPILILLDILCAFITFTVASKVFHYDIINLIERFYTYPKVRSSVILITIFSMQILFITMFEVRHIS